MTGDRRVDRNLLRAFGRFRAGPQPDYTDAVLARTATIRQRPAWAVRERWFPMQVVTEHVAGPRLPWRALAIVALVILALAVGGLLTASTREPRLPAPFGPAHNGLLAFDFWRTGDVYVADASGGTPRPLITGPDFDTTPSFSRDGTSLAFMRAGATDPAAPRRLMIANADGSDVHPLSDATFLGVSDLDWSPAGRWIAVTSVIDGTPSVSVIDVESGSSHALDVGMAVSDVSFRPPAGDDVLFVGESAGIQILYLVRSDGSDLRELSHAGAGFLRPAWSPDGSRLAYTDGRLDFAPGLEPGPVAAHIVDADGGVDRVLAQPTGVRRQVFPSWSADGRSVLVGRVSILDPDGSDFRLAIVAVDGSAPDRETPVLAWPIGSRDTTWQWAPDGGAILIGTPEGAVTLDFASGAQTDHTGWFDPAWQRVAGR